MSDHSSFDTFSSSRQSPPLWTMILAATLIHIFLIGAGAFWSPVAPPPKKRSKVIVQTVQLNHSSSIAIQERFPTSTASVVKPTQEEPPLTLAFSLPPDPMIAKEDPVPQKFEEPQPKELLIQEEPILVTPPKLEVQPIPVEIKPSPEEKPVREPPPKKTTPIEIKPSPPKPPSPEVKKPVEKKTKPVEKTQQKPSPVKKPSEPTKKAEKSEPVKPKTNEAAEKKRQQEQLAATEKKKQELAAAEKKRQQEQIEADKKRQQEKAAAQEAERKRQQEIAAAEEATRQKLVKAKENLAKMSETRDKMKASSSTHSSLKLESASLPKELGTLEIDALPLEGETGKAIEWGSKESSYRDEVAYRLKMTLKLPDYGAVKIKLTLDRTGKVIKVETVQSESVKNKLYIERTVPSIIFPSFGQKIQDVSQYTFLITLHNDS